MLGSRKLVVSAMLVAVASLPAVAETLELPRRGQRTSSTGTPSHDGPPILVRLHADKLLYQAGESIWVDFTVVNVTSSPITLRAPERPERETERIRGDYLPDEEVEGVGLPLGHVFSGVNQAALTIHTEEGASYEAHTYLFRTRQVPDVQLSPYGSVGMRIDLTRYYELLKRPGTYSLVWRPYQGDFTSKPLSITLMAEQQAIIHTNLGRMTMRFYYDEAPRHVANFIELARANFYKDLTFHRVIPGGLIQGGDPRGDGRGIRPDGKRLKAEFNSVPFEYGTVGMARSPRDPDSASCQFFICLSRQPTFDGKQTAFAYVVGDESFETLSKIASVPTSDDRPISRVYIKSVTLESVPVRDSLISNARDEDERRSGGVYSTQDEVSDTPPDSSTTRPASGDTAPQEGAVSGAISPSQGR